MGIVTGDTANIVGRMADVIIIATDVKIKRQATKTTQLLPTRWVDQQKIVAPEGLGW